MKKNKVEIHWDILDRKRLSVLQKLRFLKKEGFYLAGGTALALQIRHRKSFDFDFYTEGGFNPEKILLELQRISKNVDLIQNTQDTLIVKVNGIELSLFTYPYKLVKRLIDTEYIGLASIEDIAAMKIVAIIQRGIQRDFIDLYFLIKYLGLENIFQLTKKKYPPFNKYLGLQAITYFEDADRLIGRKLFLIEPIPWQEIKKFIICEAKEFKKIIEE